jgi:hypothetical protein
MNIEELKKIVRGNGFQESHGSTTIVIDIETVVDLLDELKQCTIPSVTHRFSKEDMWDAWWASAIKTISFSGVDKDYERRCFEKFYGNKLSASNGG